MKKSMLKYTHIIVCKGHRAQTISLSFAQILSHFFSLAFLGIFLPPSPQDRAAVMPPSLLPPLYARIFLLLVRSSPVSFTHWITDASCARIHTHTFMCDTHRAMLSFVLANVAENE